MEWREKQIYMSSRQQYRLAVGRLARVFLVYGWWLVLAFGHPRLSILREELLGPFLKKKRNLS